MPEKKRIMTQGSKYYVLEIFARKGKKVPKDDIHLVGCLDQRSDTRMHPNAYYYERHPEEANPKDEESTKEVGTFADHQNVGTYLLIKKICDDLDITAFLDEIFDGSTLVIAFLVYLLYMRDSSAQNYQSFAFSNYCGINYIPREDDWSEFFNHFLSRDKICEFFSRWFTAKLQAKEKIQVSIDFDATNGNTASSGISLAEFGHPKVDEDLPQVNWVTIVDRQTGMILFIDIYFGSIVDMDHCKTVIEKVKASYNQAIADKKGRKLTAKTDYTKNLDIRLCLDRGYYFCEIIKYLCDSCTFVIMGKDGCFFHDIVEANPPSSMKTPENRIGNSLFGIRIDDVHPFKNARFSKKLNAYLFYNSKLNDSIIDSKTNYYQEVAASLIGKKDAQRKIYATYKNQIDFVYSKRKSIIKEAKIKDEYLNELYQKTGYFFILSNDDSLSAKDAYEFYRQRDCIEKDFKDEKSECDMEKTYAQNDDAYQAKTFIRSLSSIIRSHIRYVMKPYFKQYQNETTEKVIREVGKVEIQKIGSVYKPSTKMSSKIKQIMSFFDMDNQDLYKICKEFNILAAAEQ